MNDFIILCPHCKTKLSAPEECAGLIFKCPTCNKQIHITESTLQSSTMLERARLLNATYLEYEAATRKIKTFEGFALNKPPAPNHFIPKSIIQDCIMILIGIVVVILVAILSIIYHEKIILYVGLLSIPILVIGVKNCVKITKENQKGKTSELLEKKNYLKDVNFWENAVSQNKQQIHEQKRLAAERLAAIKNSSLLPEIYMDVNYLCYGRHPICAIYTYFTKHRADNLKEAINLYENEEKEAERDHFENEHREIMRLEATRATSEATRAANAVVAEMESRQLERQMRMMNRRH